MSRVDEFDDELKRMMNQNVLDSAIQDKEIIQLDNVFQDDLEPFNLTKEDYLSDVISILQEKLPNFNEYSFIIHTDNTSKIPSSVDSSWIGDKRVLIWLGAEDKYIPEQKIKDNYHHIFSPYYWDTDNITSIPLGCYAKVSPEVVPMEERLHNISFIGCLNRNRIQMCSILSKIPSFAIIAASYAKEYRMIKLINHMCKWLNPRDYFKFTPDFGTGYNQETYMNLLRLSKISFCPRGWTNVESYRIYESMRAGCVTITEKLPDRPYYKNIPAIQVNNWKEGIQIATDLLKDQSGLLARLGEASRKFYEDNLSPEATAKIIISKLAEKAI